jgi:outer membrane protein assembly factor BamD
LAQAEAEYADFITFFPNMPEAAEAQLKIANIHFNQMEKPDRDYTHAMRAEDEYRKLILQWPDSKLVPEAKQRLLEVQEVIAEREFRVGRFYYNRQSYAAAIARLQSLADTYPLYSKADEVLYLLGQAYEAEIAMIRGRTINEAQKARMIEDFTKHAVQAYSQILTRYPLMARADDAKLRLQALHQPVPRPTKAAVAQNKAEENSRRSDPTITKVVRTFEKNPDVTAATRVGDPTLVDPKETSAKDIVQEANRAAMGKTADSENASVETVKGAPPGPDDPAPRSDTPPTGGDPSVNGTVVDNSAPTPSQPAAAELKPDAAPDPNELKPNVAENTQPLPAPPQVNEIQSGTSGSAAGQDKTGDTAASQDMASDSDISSSKKKKKKGLHKVVPF